MYTNKVINDDCLKRMKKLDNNSFDLAILDPPYNVGADKWDKVENYFEWMRDIIVETNRLLKPPGSMYLWGTSKNNDFLSLKLWMDSNLEIKFKNWIVWVHEVKIHKKLKDRFLCKHEDLLFYAGSGNTFNIVRDDPPPFQLKMHKGRYDNKFFITPDKLPPSQAKIFKNGLQLGSPAKSWWRGPSNQSNSKEIKKFAGYKSLWVCERIITASSNKNDSVLIPFAGTGTECLACKLNKRKFVAYEIDKNRYQISLDRIK